MTPPNSKRGRRTFFTALALIVGVPLLIWCGALYIVFHFVWKYW